MTFQASRSGSVVPINNRNLLAVPSVQTFIAWLVAASPTLRMAAVHLIRE